MKGYIYILLGMVVAAAAIYLITYKKAPGIQLQPTVQASDTDVRLLPPGSSKAATTSVQAVPAVVDLTILNNYRTK